MIAIRRRWVVLYSDDADFFALSTTAGSRTQERLNCLAAPSSWMGDKLSGTYVRSSHPTYVTRCVLQKICTHRHPASHLIPLTIFLRNGLKYELTSCKVASIIIHLLIKVGGKVCADGNLLVSWPPSLSEGPASISVLSMLSRAVSPFGASHPRRQYPR